MMKTTSRMIVTAAAASLAFVPIAANANTRAGDSNAVYSAPASQPGLSRSAEGENVFGAGFLAALAAAFAAAGVIIILDDDDDDLVDDDFDQSPGT